MPAQTSSSGCGWAVGVGEKARSPDHEPRAARRVEGQDRGGMAVVIEFPPQGLPSPVPPPLVEFNPAQQEGLVGENRLAQIPDRALLRHPAQEAIVRRFTKAETL